VALDVVGEHFEHTLDVANSAIGVVTGSASVDLVTPAVGACEVAAVCATGSEPPHRLRDIAEPEKTRTALAGTFPRHVRHDVSGLDKGAALTAKNADDAARV
jgi:hypothetical protein